MAAVFQWTTTGESNLLTDYLVEIATFNVHLYTNNHTPVPTDTSPATYTETTYTGYAAQVMGTMGTVALTGNIAYSDSATLNFGTVTDAGGLTIYGFYVTDSGNTVVQFAEILNAPIVTVTGFPVLLQIRLRVKNP